MTDTSYDHMSDDEVVATAQLLGCGEIYNGGYNLYYPSKDIADSRDIESGYIDWRRRKVSNGNGYVGTATKRECALEWIAFAHSRAGIPME